MENPYLTSLSFSGGKQSSVLLWMVILGYIKRPKNFVVLNADPGMENSKTYEYVEMMKHECKKVNIEFYTVDGPNLYEDIINLPSTNKTRFDVPPYWTKNEDGSIGRLLQKCTQAYKIYPMRRKIRALLQEKYNIPTNRTRLGRDIVETWIGFTYDEIQRIKPSDRKYVKLTYPLIDMKFHNSDVLNFYKENNLPIPPRSVCNACFSNGLNTYREMFKNRPKDWQQAVNVDNSVRDWTQINVKNPVYVSNSLLPLQELALTAFELSGADKNVENEYSCDSGFCFV